MIFRLTDVVTVVQSHCGSVTTSHGPDVSTGITPRVFDPDDPNLMCELQDLELFNIDLQVLCDKFSFPQASRMFLLVFVVRHDCFLFMALCLAYSFLSHFVFGSSLHLFLHQATGIQLCLMTTPPVFGVLPNTLSVQCVWHVMFYVSFFCSQPIDIFCFDFLAFWLAICSFHCVLTEELEIEI